MRIISQVEIEKLGREKKVEERWLIVNRRLGDMVNDVL